MISNTQILSGNKGTERTVNNLPKIVSRHRLTGKVHDLIHVVLKKFKYLKLFSKMNVHAQRFLPVLVIDFPCKINEKCINSFKRYQPRLVKYL